MNFVAVAAGGALGALLRYGIGLFATSLIPIAWAVFFANLLGCFLLGVYFGYRTHAEIPQNLHLFILTGFLGGLTTFSSLMLDVVKLSENSNYFMMAVYILASLILGFALYYFGKFLTA